MGTSIEITETAGVSYYKAKRGRSEIFAGGPLVEGSTVWAPHATLDQIVTCPSYLIPADGTITSWCLYQGNSTTSQLPFEVGEVMLVVLYLEGADYKIRGLAPMTRRITKKGVWEFPISPGLSVERNDLVAFWIKAASNLDVVGQPSREGESLNPVRTFNSAAPAAGDNLGAGAVTLSASLFAVTVRGDIVDEQIFDVDSGWLTDGTEVDSYSYVAFVRGATAFDDAGWTTPENLFDEVDTTNATAPTGTTKNIYYYLPTGPTIIPAERFIVKAPLIPSGGSVAIYISENDTVAQTLAGAQAIPSDEWMKVVEIFPATSTNLHDELEYHIARGARWIRLTVIGGTAATTSVGAFEVKAHPIRVASGGQFAPLATPSGLKDRYFFDGADHEAGDAISAVLTGDISGTGILLSVASAEAAFFTQLVLEGYLWLRKNLPLGSTNKMVRVKIAGWDATAKTITLESGPGEVFSAGDFVDPDPFFYRFTAHRADGSVFAASNWIGNHSTDMRWLRNHDVYTAAGN